MKIRSRSFLLLAMCLGPGMLMSVCAQDSTKTTAAVEWQRYELAKGACSALFPSKPSEEFKPSPQSEEISADMYLHFASTPNGVTVGSVVPDLWMKKATGAPVGPEALLNATKKALSEVETGHE